MANKLETLLESLKFSSEVERQGFLHCISTIGAVIGNYVGLKLVTVHRVITPELVVIPVKTGEVSQDEYLFLSKQMKTDNPFALIMVLKSIREEPLFKKYQEILNSIGIPIEYMVFSGQHQVYVECYSDLLTILLQITGNKNENRRIHLN